MYKLIVTQFGFVGKQKVAESDNLIEVVARALYFAQYTSLRTSLIVDNSGKVLFWAKRVDASSNWIIEDNSNNPELSIAYSGI